MTRSAAIAQRAGFKALWASGLSISSGLRYRDAKEVAVVEGIAEARKFQSVSRSAANDESSWAWKTMSSRK